MPKEDAIEVTGKVLETSQRDVSSGMDNGHKVLAHISGKMRCTTSRSSGEIRSRIELSPYDLARGRIIFRER
jgi:translation initiation factor IF-1